MSPALAFGRGPRRGTLLDRVRRELHGRQEPLTTAEVVRELAAAPEAQLRETHGAWVVLSDGRAVKIKKPVRFSFMDFGTVEARRRACQEEVRLNQDLAPGLYVGVRPVVTTPPYIGVCRGQSDVVDYAVEMRRFDEHSTMEALLDSGRLREGHVAAVAARVAAFHAAAPAARAAFPQPSTWQIRALADLDDIAAAGVETADRRRFCVAAVARQAPVMRGRWEAGLVREGHGDLRAQHVLLTAPLRIVDRLEFSRALRVADVADDLAFLAMDLERRGARWAAELLVEAYAAAGGAPAPPALAALFAWRRAIVRAKVALIVGDEAAASEALALAGRLAWRARRPVAIAVTGPPAGGKSTLARLLGEALEVPVLSSDVVRKRLHGMAPGARGGDRLYSPAATEATYAALADMARATAGPSGGVVVDATFATAAHRRALQAALGDVRWVVCDAPPATLAARAAARAASGRSVSDAGPEVALALRARFHALGAPEGALELDTRTPADELGQRVGAWLDRPVRR